MYKLFNHQGNVYKILREIPFHNFEKDELEGVAIGVWLKRFWNTLENNNLLL